MWWEVFRFELAARLRRVSTPVYFTVLFGLAFLFINAAGGAFEGAHVAFGGGGKILVDSPYTLTLVTCSLAMFGSLIIAAFAGRAVQQDFQLNTAPLLFTTSVTRGAYLGGRYSAAVALSLLALLGIACGLGAGALMPWLDREKFGALSIAGLLLPYATLVLPNVLFLGALFFSVATLTRKAMAVHVMAVVLLIGYVAAAPLLADIDNKLLASLIDPFGGRALGHLTQYWSVAEKNTRLIPFTGVYLWNRLLWLALGAGVLGWTMRRFRLAHADGAERGPRRAGAAADVQAEVSVAAASAKGVMGLKLSAPGWIRRGFAHTRFELRAITKNVYFRIIVGAGALLMAVMATQLDEIYGTPTYPVTYQVVEVLGGSFALFVIVVITFLSGELVWRERDAGLVQITDATPSGDVVLLGGKLAALVATQAILLAALVACGIAVQTAYGYYHYELGLYLKLIFGYQLPDYALLCVLALSIHVVVNNKYVGHFIIILFYILQISLSSLGFEHNLYNYGSDPGFQYSDMNRFGHFLKAVVWYKLYWAAVAAVLLVVVRLLWVRTLDTGIRVRLALARQRLGRGAAGALGGSAGLAVALGSFIAYNTCVLNTFRTSVAGDRRYARYEREYRRFESLPQPRIVSVSLDVDIDPPRRSARIRGEYGVVNKNNAPVTQVLVSIPDEAQVAKLTVLGEPAAALSDADLGVFRYDLSTPLAPGAAGSIDFELSWAPAGFRDDAADTDIVYNGTFIGFQALPIVGYTRWMELTDDERRKKQDLAPKERMAARGDMAARANTYLRADSDWVSFAATLSTSPTQIALAPGYLEREWTENGRRYFRYRMDEPILNFVSFLSAEYQVRRDQWKDVAIEIYYHKGHEYNLNRMVKGVQRSLDYYTEHFGPYQHKQVRIVEFPRYHTFAQSFPNTIPYSESLGFIAHVDELDPEDIDYPFYVTAHEVAHQWWAHQVIGANVKGATMLSESLAQYSALMVMEREFGEEKMRRFLKYELDRYLMDRGSERKKEMPLAEVENQQYIHYQKGSLIFYALKDYIGEDTLNGVLRAYLQGTARQGPPFTTTEELVAVIKEATPDQYSYIVDDFFNRIVLYQNRVVKVTARALAGGEYEVTLRVQCDKMVADELGNESAAALRDYFDIGVLDAEGHVLYLQKHLFDHAGEQSIAVSVRGKPAKAGIDPFNKLIDRNSDDNVMAVEVASE
ncbi:MAG: hypothetical protein HYV63_33645 [Candidatus Schekmanbacteria bacterium]|nr:hypothetical protein [Candidatus Schekmanbacteria bacterium]